MPTIATRSRIPLLAIRSSLPGPSASYTTRSLLTLPYGGGITVQAREVHDGVVEAQGLLPRPRRSPSGYRLYADRDLKRLAFIQRAKLLGLPLAKIQDLVIHLTEEGRACPTIRPHLERSIRDQVKDVGTRLDQLALLKNELEAFLAKMSRAKRALANQLCACIEEVGADD